jgi:hypothetical protein
MALRVAFLFCMICLTTLSVIQAILRHELERMWMEAVVAKFEATNWRLPGVTEESQNSSGQPILVSRFKPGICKIRSESAAFLYRSACLKRDLQCGYLWYGHDQLNVRLPSAEGTVTISSRYAHAQLKVRSRSAQGTVTLSSRYDHD